MHLLIMMPYPQGSGLAWTYIERVVNDLSHRWRDRGDECTIAYPRISPSSSEFSATTNVIARMFYGTAVGATVENARWMREKGITHLYLAEHAAFDWRFALYRSYANVKIAVHYHHAGGRSKPYTGFAGTLRAGRSAIKSAMADIAICVSRFVRDRVVTVSLVPRERCVAIYNAVIPEFFVDMRQLDTRRDAVRNAWGVAADEIVILSGARAAMEKGLDTLFVAFDQLCGERSAKQARLPWVVYAGDGPDFDKLNTLRLALQHGNRILMLGRVVDMQRLQLASDIAVLASRCDEAFGLFAAESMQAGLPVIVTKRGGLVEIVDDDVNGFLIDSDDVSALLQKLRSLVEDSPLRERMGRAAIAKMRTDFDYSNMLKELDLQIRQMSVVRTTESA
ncbi:MAG: glycosyltransferase family 4 protein, partial [Gemmatimonadota bacterium]|nr:glycosyltransferase family 4 protein [Gemmatimonadota bacterium]